MPILVFLAMADKSSNFMSIPITPTKESFSSITALAIVTIKLLVPAVSLYGSVIIGSPFISTAFLYQGLVLGSMLLTTSVLGENIA